MDKLHKTLTTTTGRALVFLAITITGAALHELLVELIRPPAFSNSLIALTISTLIAFPLLGALLVNTRHLKSRATSAATLFVLVFIVLRIGHSPVPDPYLLVIALIVSVIGALPVLHRKALSMKAAIMYTLIAASIAVIGASTFIYTMMVIGRLALA